MHAGVNLEPHLLWLLSECVTPVQLICPVQGGPNIEVHAEREIRRTVRALEYQYRLGYAGVAKCDGFFDQCDRKRVNRTLDMGRDRHRAVPVRVGFDDGHYVLVACCRAQHPGVVQDCAKVDVNAGRSGH